MQKTIMNNYMKKNTAGFTLIELMTVTIIIVSLASIAIPSYQDYIKRARVAESLSLSSVITQNIAAYYAWHGIMPTDNQTAGLPPPENLKGIYVERMEIKDGAIHIKMREEIFNKFEKGVLLSLRPALLANAPGNQILWICGYADIIPDFVVQGENRTDINPHFLPTTCRP